jgi:hypothetical protein
VEAAQQLQIRNRHDDPPTFSLRLRCIRPLPRRRSRPRRAADGRDPRHAPPPVKAALAPLREWLAAQGTKLKVIETDVESPQGEKRLAAVGLSGHVPIVILIDGQYRHKRKDGTVLEFMNFPAIESAPPGVRGKWTTADVQEVLGARIKGR